MVLFRRVKVEISIVRPGFGRQSYSMPAGSTLGELFEKVGVTTEGQLFTVNGEPADRSTPLTAPAVVGLIPAGDDPAADPSQPAQDAALKPWHATIPAFRDEGLHRAFRDALEARREAELAEEDGPG